MGKARFIVQSSRSCFRKWKSAPRMLVLLGMIACFTIIYAMPFAENAEVQNETLQCAEIFIAMMNWRFTMLLFSTAMCYLTDFDRVYIRGHCPGHRSEYKLF